MSLPSQVEFYREGMLQPFLIINSELQPLERELVNINGVTWEVVGRSFAVDHANNRVERRMRCNLIVREYKGAKSK